MDLKEAKKDTIESVILEAQESMNAAWGKAQAYFDAHMDSDGSIRQDSYEAYLRLLARVEQHEQHLARLDKARSQLASITPKTIAF